jgi:hypothetical protein
MLAMVQRAFPLVRLIICKPNLPPVDDTPDRPEPVRLLNVNNHFMSLRRRSELPASQSGHLTESLRLLYDRVSM